MSDRGCASASSITRIPKATPIAAAITALLVIVVLSYRQTVRAYPGGGSSYIVASETLGRGAGLLAAAAILSDYVLTVAVSISAGTLAIEEGATFMGQSQVGKKAESKPTGFGPKAAQP